MELDKIKSFSIFILILLSFILPIRGQIITTIAGTGSSGSSGDGGLATSATFGSVNGGVFDSRGNYYFAENLNNKIRKIDTSGIITTVAGIGSFGYSGDGGQATSAKLYYPSSVAFDTLDNLYIADGQNNRIRKVDHSTGIISTIAGNGTAAFGGDGGQATVANLYYPSDLCFDRLGNLYIADCNNKRVRKIDISGTITTIAGSGVAGYSGDGGFATAARFTPFGLCIDFIGNIYIADNGYGETRIAKVDTSGVISTFAGTDTGYVFNGDGITATTANISPLRIYVDNIGELYLADYANNKIRKIDLAGIIHTVAGTGSMGYGGDGGLATAATLYHPSGIAFDLCNNLVFPDLNNFRIRKVTIPFAHTPSTLSITSSTGDTICSGMPVTFTAHTAATGTLTYQWRVNGASVGSGGASYTYNPVNGDSVQCVVINTTPCYTDTITSNTLHIVTRNLAVTLAGVVSAPLGTSVTLNATVTGADSAYTLQWRNKGVLFNTTTVPMVTYTKTISIDSITATVISASRECDDTAVSGVHVVLDNNTKTSPFPSEGGVTCYPNPVGDALHIEAYAQIESVIVTNLLGQTVYGGAREQVVPVKELPAGVYFVKVFFIGGGAVVERFLKR